VSKPRVAVIIPCFNDGLLAVDAVASVREAEAVEIVVVDDGSTDPVTVSALDELRRDGVRVLNKPNGGLSSARMAGLAASQARYVFPLDSDDLLAEGALSRMADALDRDPGAVFAYGDFDTFGDYRGYYRPPATFDPWLLTWQNVIPVSSLIRRVALDAADGWELPTGYEDWDLWLKFADRDWYGVYVAGGPVYHRRLHGSSRMLAGCRARHGELYDLLISRHAGLWARRGELQARSRPTAVKRAICKTLLGRRDHVPVRVEAALQRFVWRVQARRYLPRS
jgi:glycosyltransferase involved in cell wall biosynthesis